MIVLTIYNLRGIKSENALKVTAPFVTLIASVLNYQVNRSLQMHNQFNANISCVDPQTQHAGHSCRESTSIIMRNCNYCYLIDAIEWDKPLMRTIYMNHSFYGL